MKTDHQKEKYRPLFERILIFRALTPPAQEFLLRRAEILQFEEAEPIVEEGDLSPSFFVILDGNVSISMNQNGTEVYINTLGPGQLFGEAAMFLKSKRTANVKALEPCTVLKLTRFDVMEFLSGEPREGNKLLLSIVYGLLYKLKSSNQELAFERRGDAQQDDIDALVAELSM